VLEAAGILRARAILVTVPAFPDVRSIVRAVRQLRPDLPIIARADGFNAVRALYALGIQEVTSPEFEAAIEMTRQALMYFNVPAHDVLRVARAIRRERYGQTGEKGDSGLLVMSQLGDIARQLDFTWVGVPSESSFDGRTLSELQIRTTTGASVPGPPGSSGTSARICVACTSRICAGTDPNCTVAPMPQPDCSNWSRKRSASPP